MSEPGTTWSRRNVPRVRDRAPDLRRRPRRRDRTTSSRRTWRRSSTTTTTPGSCASAGRWRAPRRWRPTSSGARSRASRPDPNAGMGKNRRHEANGRPGHSDAGARLADMDDDGVEASVSYCEVSSFRYLYLIEDGWKEATRAFNETLGDFAVGRPEATDRRRTRSRSTTSTPRWPRCSGRRRSGASRSSCPCTRPSSAYPTTGTSATTRCWPRSRRPGCRSAATSA